MKKHIIYLLIIAMYLCSCTRHFHNIDSLPYLLRVELFKNGEEHSYELLHDGSDHYNSKVRLSQTYSYEPNTQFMFLFSTLDIPIDKRDWEFEFEIDYTSKDSCFIDRKQYQLTAKNVNLVSGQLEEGWFSLCLPQDSDSGIAYSIVFDMSFIPYDGYEKIYTLSGTVEVAKDFIGYEHITYVTNKWGKVIEIRAPHWNGEGLIR